MSHQHEGAPFATEDLPAEVKARLCAHPVARWDEIGPDVAALGIAKLRLAGVYDDRQPGHFMVRVRIPGGSLNAAQARVLAGVASTFSHRPARAPGEPTALWDEAPECFVEITTRQDVQLHWIAAADLPRVWEDLDAAGLTTIAACGDTLRNVTTCPRAGVASEELIDPRPAVDAVGALAIDEPRLAARLPRKFKVAVTGCPTDCVGARLHDLAFTPARRDGIVGFNVFAGGGLSDSPRLASPLGMFVTSEGVAPLVRAALTLYSDRGDREHKAVNRFRVLVHEMGPATVAEELRSLLSPEPPEAGEDLSTWRACDHIGVHPERGGTSSVGLCVPLGRLTADDLDELTLLARRHGDGGIRLTQRQNLILTGVADPGVLLQEPLTRRLRADPDPFERAVIACTSAPFCKYALLNAKAFGADLIDRLRDSVAPDRWGALQGLRIHISGCKASCALTQAAHIGLRGAPALTGDGYRDAVDVCAGGDLGRGRLAAWAAPEVTPDAALPVLAELLEEAAAYGLDAITPAAVTALLQGHGHAG